MPSRVSRRSAIRWFWCTWGSQSQRVRALSYQVSEICSQGCMILTVRCLRTGGVLWLYSLNLLQTSDLPVLWIGSREVMQRFYRVRSSMLWGLRINAHATIGELSQRMTPGDWIDGMSCIPLNRDSVNLFDPWNYGCPVKFSHFFPLQKEKFLCLSHLSWVDFNALGIDI